MPKRDIALDYGEVPTSIDSDSLCTPPEILNPLYELYGGMIDTDPCSNPHSIVRARQAFHEGGLVVPWSYRGRSAKGYQNHPYSTNEPWAVKFAREWKLGHLSEHVVLCMACPSTIWWLTFMTAPVNPRVIFTKRLNFLGPDGKPLKDSARFDTALIYYGRRRAQHRRFDALYRHVARWSTWGR